MCGCAWQGWQVFGGRLRSHWLSEQPATCAVLLRVLLSVSSCVALLHHFSTLHGTLLPRHRSHPAVLAHLRASGERLLLLGHRSKWETVDIPAAVADVVAVLESLPYQARGAAALRGAARGSAGDQRKHAGR